MAVEVKSPNNPGYRDISGLQDSLSEHPEATAGLLFHNRCDIKRLDEKILAISWTMLTG
jgi:hypothetical protein